jgi:hypothetical protein
MTNKKQSAEYSEEEATRRMNDVLKRLLTSPHKPQSAYKVGKRMPHSKKPKKGRRAKTARREANS